MKIVLTLLLALFITGPISAQKEIKYARQGNKEFKSTRYDDAELLYRRSADENPSYGDALFNLGDALYKQEKYEDAFTSFESLAESELDPVKKSSTLYNLGNTLVKENKLKESIEAYKSSLRLNPDNLEAKHNLAYAQDQLKKQEEQEKDKEQENKDKDQNNNKEDQDKQKKENEDKEQDQEEEKQNKENESEDNKDNPEDKKEQEQNQNQISKEDAERLLQALAADEQEVQDKVKKAKASRKKVRTLKNW
jgi:Ca-activated chloride channel family protein